MKRILSFFIPILMLTASCTSAADEPSLVITGVRVLDMNSDQVSPPSTIVVRDGVIIWYGSGALPSRFSHPDNEIITGNYYVMPGLSEMHAHIPPASQGQQYMEDVLVMYASQGVTTIRGMLGDPAHLVLRERAASGEIISPRIFTSGPSFNGNSVREPESAREMVRAQKEAGYDLLKLHPGLSVEVFEAIADEARKIGIEFSGHISHSVGLERTLASGKGSIDHLDRYIEFLAGDAGKRQDPSIIYFGYDLADYADSDRIPLAVQKTREAGVWNVPTNTLLENVFNPDLTLDIMNSWPGMDLLPGNLRSGWNNFITMIRNQHDYDPDKACRFLEIRKELTAELNRQNAGLLLGADAPQIFNPPGFSALRELKLLTEYGLSPFDAIKTGTVNVGVYLDEPGITGKIETGFRADLIILDVNPLENIDFGDRIRGVVLNGRYVSRTEFDQLLDDIRNRRSEE